MTDTQLPAGGPEFHKLSYLIVDDFENFRLSMRHMLRSFGVTKAEVVSNGTAAVQMCTYDQFDVVLCDYNLGEGKNGQHVLEELRHKKLLKRTSLFLLVTAETSKEMVMGAREYQPDAYLTKPINRAMLEKRLGALIAQRNALLPINREIDRENLPEAASLCLQAIPRQPRYKSWLLKTLADLYFQMGDFSHARKIYDDVLAQRDLSWARLGRSRVLLAEQQLEESVAELRTLIESHPDFLEAYDLLADALTRQGKLGQAQQTLETAAELSPNALLRQRSLATIATTTQDIERATEAWRRTVQLGTHSIHDNVEHYLALGRSLSDISEVNIDEGWKDQASEALNLLAKMEKRFPEAPDVTAKSLLIQARVHAGQGQMPAANKALAEAHASVDADSVSAQLGLELAKTLFRMKRGPEAEKLLNKLAERFSDDTEVLQNIEALLDEPVGFKQKLQARALNREGIKAFESGDLEAAVKVFEKALAIVPAHAALNLNLVQVHMKQLAEGARDPQLVARSRRRLDALANLPEQHRQYRRYETLRKKLDAMKND
ncbi:tetratricopeptide repeat-containing response regulator [Marinobacter salicampi]|uniref:tetratricopeptide repeat-containing response regulator n=1 Tax=Marinobacter salicampi TaxID=435907 RepID=UPI00140A2FD4|nr:tetratricopeptide repeat-containing response regulator [Marinobacter salicampi]